jgi:hypothetical protein
MKTSKAKLGQFYTTNYEYILTNMKIPDDVLDIIEPFCGYGDLLKFLKKDYNLECYDIEPKKSYIIERDTLKNPPNYDGKFVLTNPPYIAKNKNDDKEIYEIYKTDDLYKCFIKSLIKSKSIGGIIIIPINFICSHRNNDVKIRKDFIEKFKIKLINIFEERVFDDTSISVCVIQYELRKDNNDEIIKIDIYPSKKSIEVELNDRNDYMIGGEILKLCSLNSYEIERATRNSKQENISNILLKTIDDMNRINAMMVEDDKRIIDNTDNLSMRSYATLTINPMITKEKQKILVERFNELLKENRERYHSLFLSNYRENNRKRISFELAFRIFKYLLDN